MPLVDIYRPRRSSLSAVTLQPVMSRLGGTSIIMKKFDAEAALRLIQDERITHSQWVPTMFVRLLALAPR